jgi:hypothetical protein
MVGSDAPDTRAGGPAGTPDRAALGTPTGNGAGCAPPETACPRTTLTTGVPYADWRFALLEAPDGATLLGGA